MNGGNGREHADREALRECLSAYLDGELAPADAAALERHLAACAECRDELAALREVRALLRALPPPALPRSFALPPNAAARAARTPAAAQWSPEGQPIRAAHAPRPGPVALPGRAPVATLARAAQWVGSLAAAFGVLLIVATAVLGPNPGATRTYSAAPALSSHAPRQAGTTAQQTATTPPQQTPTRPSVVQGVGTGTPTQPAASAPSPTSGQGAAPTSPASTNTPTNTPPASASPAEPFPVLPVTGAGLLAGGVVLFGAGSLAARRRRQRPPVRRR